MVLEGQGGETRIKGGTRRPFSIQPEVGGRHGAAAFVYDQQHKIDRGAQGEKGFIEGGRRSAGKGGKEEETFGMK